MSRDTTTVPTTAADPGRLSELSEQIATGELSPVALVERYLARVDAVEGDVKAWRELDGARALEVAKVRADEVTAGQIRGPLHGIPIGVKDIIDVAGLPTRCNSRSRADAPPATCDSDVVLQLKAAGAIVLGKLHTTEFAFYDPSPACNPWNLEHTPGGSSSGSGAALGAGMVPVALGTQTMASANRPAAYCGVACFKPSSRSLSTFGVAPLAASYDTIGLYGGRVDDAVAVFEAAMPPFMRARNREDSTDAPLKIVILDDPLISDMDADMQAALSTMSDAFRSGGHTVETRVSPVAFARIAELHWLTMIYEIATTHTAFLDLPEGQIGDRLAGAIRQGLQTPTDTYLDARGELDRLRVTLLKANADAQIFLWPATPTSAPRGLASTGEPKYIAPWTAINSPMGTIPAGRDSKGMPIACILCGHPGTDQAVASWARDLAQLGEISPFA